MNTNQERNMDPVDQAGELAQDIQERLDLVGGIGSSEGISSSQHKILSIVDQNGPISMGIVARLAGSAQSTTSEMSGRLMKQGLIAKARGPYDGRVVVVELTDAGRQQVARYRKRKQDAYRELVDSMSAEDRGSFVDSLKRIVEILRQRTD